MKITVASSLVAVATIVVFYAFAPSAAEVFNVDTSQSKISWVGQNVAGGKHTGTIGLSRGALMVEKGKLTGASFTADIGSIAVTDLTGGRATRLEDHLKNEDFFDAKQFPEATFGVTKVRGSDNDVTITGELTIKGITRSITFPAEVHQVGSTLHATAKGVKINRTQFDIKYRSGNFFSGLGDRAILDEFELDIELVATK